MRHAFLAFALVSTMIVACGSDDDTKSPGGASGSSGAAGLGGAAGLAGAGGSAGISGSAGTGGSAGTAGSSGQAGGSTFDQACAAAANADCTTLETCAPFLVQRLWGDKALCVERTKLSCLIDAALPGTGLQASSLEACAQATLGLTCDELRERTVPAACLPDPGTLDDTAECDDDSQCKSAYCDMEPGICGTCMTRISAGGDCSSTPYACEPGLVCSNGGKCSQPAGENAACGTTEPCKESLRCINAKCVPPLGLGQSCTNSHECDAWQGLLCGTDNTCQKLALVAAGEACGALAQAPTNCLASGDCHTPGGDTGTCVAPAADGAACDYTAGIHCLEPAECVDDICKLPHEFTCN